MIAYHGTNSDFTQFDASFLGLNTDNEASSEALAQTAHLGFWFTDNKEHTSSVYNKVMDCEIALENPYQVDSLETLAYWMDSCELTAEEAREQLEGWGYDGIVVEADEEFCGTSYVAFYSHQVEVLN